MRRLTLRTWIGKHLLVMMEGVTLGEGDNLDHHLQPEEKG